MTAKATFEQKLSDGNTISGFMVSHQVRDSQGRTRTENPIHCGTENGQPEWQGYIFVSDPVAKTSMAWEAGQSWVMNRKTVHVSHPSFAPPAPRTTVERQAYKQAEQKNETYARDIEHRKVEDLGTRNIAGVEASGIRITRTVPAGKYGNAQPLTYVDENWESERYGIFLIAITDDPVHGKSTYEVTDFTPSEPDASWFQPPAGYKVEERVSQVAVQQ